MKKLKRITKLDFWRKLLNGMMFISLLYAWLVVPFLAVNEMGPHIDKTYNPQI